MDRGVYDAPLPGGADVGEDPLTLSATFDDVVDLVPQASVKLDNVAVGRVEEISLSPDGRSAVVTMVVNRDAALPEGTQARLRQTSLLGEKYVALIRPPKARAGGLLPDGAELGLSDTSQTAEVEQVLGALSMVLNGGDLAKFRDISRELQKISAGRPKEIKKFLREMETFVSGLDDRKEAITAALDGLNALSHTLERDKDKIVTALEELSPGMEVMVRQRKQFVEMLQALDRLSSVTVRTLNAAQDDMVADLKLLDPILDQLAKSGDDLPTALEIMLTYPFPDSVLGAIQGDYFNVFVTTNFQTLPAGCAAIGCFWEQPDPNAGLGGSEGPAPRSWPEGVDPSESPSPSLLPPTDSASPGLPTPTITVPSPSGASPTAPSSSAGPSPSSPTHSGGAEEPSELGVPSPESEGATP